MSSIYKSQHAAQIYWLANLFQVDNTAASPRMALRNRVFRYTPSFGGNENPSFSVRTLMDANCIPGPSRNEEERPLIHFEKTLRLSFETHSQMQ